MRTYPDFSFSRLRVCSGLGAGLSVLLLSGCGPTPADFVGTYAVRVEETFSDCTRGTPAATLLPNQQSLTIREGEDASLTLTLWDCTFAATIVEAGVLRVEDQTCAVSLDDATALIEVSGDGQVSDNQTFTALLEGTYTGTDSAGFQQACSYSLQIASPESSTARGAHP